MDINSIKVKTFNFTMKLMQHLSYYFSPHLQKSTYKDFDTYLNEVRPCFKPEQKTI